MNKFNQAAQEDTSNECKLYVQGMHCASCEILIEKKLLKLDGIHSVDASTKDNTIIVRYKGDNKPEPEELNKYFAELDYKFSTKQFKTKSTPALSFREGKLLINPTKLTRLAKVAVTVVAILVGFYLVEKMQFGKYISVDSSSSLPAFFVLGLVAGLSSCAALIGGLLLSMTKQWNDLYIDSDSTRQKAQPHIMFHSGRIISFIVLGGVLGAVGKTISLDNTSLFSSLTIFVSVIMLLLALQMLEVEWAQKLSFRLPKVISRFVVNEDNFQGKQMPLVLGILTFVLPCGFTLIAQTAALASGSFTQGALIMFAFALGTLPILIGISYSGLTFNSKPHLTAKFNQIAGILIVFFALYNINGQFNVLGYKSLSDVKLITMSTDTAKIEAPTEIKDGEQVINITAKGFEYLPTSSMTINSGVPTRLIVDNQGIQGCGAFMAANGLIDNYVELKRGLNTIQLENPQKGLYKLTCAMGMVPPVTINVI